MFLLADGQIMMRMNLNRTDARRCDLNKIRPCLSRRFFLLPSMKLRYDTGSMILVVSHVVLQSVSGSI